MANATYLRLIRAFIRREKISAKSTICADLIGSYHKYNWIQKKGYNVALWV